MSRKESINKMRELLVTRRNALRKALQGDLSLLSQLREQSGGGSLTRCLMPLKTKSAPSSPRWKAANWPSSGACPYQEWHLRRMRNRNERIPLARLNALPYATSCIECQRAAENSGGAGGGSGDWSRVLCTAGFTDVDVSFSDLET